MHINESFFDIVLAFSHKSFFCFPKIIRYFLHSDIAKIYFSPNMQLLFVFYGINVYNGKRSFVQSDGAILSKEVHYVQDRF